MEESRNFSTLHSSLQATENDFSSPLHFSTLNSEKIIFCPGDDSTKKVNLSSQATANWDSSTLRSEESINTDKFLNLPPKLLIHTKIYEKLDYFLKNNRVPHIIFHGSSGTGKKTIVYNFINKIYSYDLVKIKTNVMFVNCAHGKGIKFIRDELKFFAKTNVHLTSSTSLNSTEDVKSLNFDGGITDSKNEMYGEGDKTTSYNEKINKNKETGIFFKTIILLNADFLTIDAQSALRRCIELFSYNTRFIIIVENKNKLLYPILSRFCEIHVPEQRVSILKDSSVRSVEEDPYFVACQENCSVKDFKFIQTPILNLHQYNLNLNSDLIEYKKKRKEELNYILNKFYEYAFNTIGEGISRTKNISSTSVHSEESIRNITIEKYIFTLSSDLYNMGVSCLDIIEHISDTEEVVTKSTSFQQNSFSPTLNSCENGLPSQATANWDSSTLRSEESLNKPATEIRNQINEEHRLKILMRFYKIKSEYRNEKLLIAYILNMIVYPEVFDETL